MNDTQNPFDAADWELSDDYYQEQEGRPELKLEDFMTEDEAIPSPISLDNTDSELSRTISDVKNVLSVYGEGKSVEEIAHLLSLEADYVHTILYCAQGFPEDDPIAVARLVMMS